MDAEGLDELILRDLKNLFSIPKVICAETCEYGGARNHVAEIYDILRPLGYMIFIDTRGNTIFVLKELGEKTLMQILSNEKP